MSSLYLVQIRKGAYGRFDADEKGSLYLKETVTDKRRATQFYAKRNALTLAKKCDGVVIALVPTYIGGDQT